MILTKLEIDSDLSEAAVEHAMSKLYGESAKTLFVSTYNLKYAPDIARKYQIMYQVDDELPTDAWYVKNKYFGVFSPGA